MRGHGTRSRGTVRKAEDALSEDRIDESVARIVQAKLERAS